MIYARSIYYAVLWADNGQKTKHPTTRRQIAHYIRQASKSLGSEVLTTRIGDGNAAILVELNPLMPIETFIEKLKTWMTIWIVGEDEQINYWAKHWYSPISPEDITKAQDKIHTLPDNPPSYPIIPDKAQNCHHIIIITSRSRLLIPTKYKILMAEVTTETARKLRADVVASAAMRNHVHLLCNVPTDHSLAEFIRSLKTSLHERMRENIHLRKVEGWSDETIAHTVSPKRINDEEHDILDQEFIHRGNHIRNEMSPLYQKMKIPYVTSLH